MSADNAAKDHSGAKYYLNIEGEEYYWSQDTITTAELRSLGNLPPDLPVIEEAADGTERTLAGSEAVQLQPGHRYGRAAKYRRGYRHA